jgi:hypothetical protein
MTRKSSSKVLVEPESKDCKICLVHKDKKSFSLHPTPNNPLRRRDQCTDCRNTLIRVKLKKEGTHKKRYDAMTDEERKIYSKIRSEQNQIRFKTKPEALVKKKLHDKSDKGVYSRYVHDCKRRTRLTRGITMDLTFEQFSEIINKPCTYCNTENARGVDRIDSSKSYTIENSTPCCKFCNQMKSDLSCTEFLAHISKIYKNSL